MEVIILESAQAASELAARLVARRVRELPECTLGLATGGTPKALYAELIRMHHDEGLDFKRVTTFNLDEYLGIPGDHPGSYRREMQKGLFDHLNIPSDRTHLLDGSTHDPIAECAAFENRIQRAGGIDLQLLGIGGDGHIGFNEPTSSLASRTRIKTLTRETRMSHAGHFGGEANVPPHVLTMGIGTILEAEEQVLLAFGESKADAIAATVEGPVTAYVPASCLQMHKNVRIFLDEGAASKLKRARYYRETFAGKPDWQRV